MLHFLPKKGICQFCPMKAILSFTKFENTNIGRSIITWVNVFHLRFTFLLRVIFYGIFYIIIHIVNSSNIGLQYFRLNWINLQKIIITQIIFTTHNKEPTKMFSFNNIHNNHHDKWQYRQQKKKKNNNNNNNYNNTNIASMINPYYQQEPWVLLWRRTPKNTFTTNNHINSTFLTFLIISSSPQQATKNYICTNNSNVS